MIFQSSFLFHTNSLKLKSPRQMVSCTVQGQNSQSLPSHQEARFQFSLKGQRYVCFWADFPVLVSTFIPSCYYDSNKTGRGWGGQRSLGKIKTVISVPFTFFPLNDTWIHTPTQKISSKRDYTPIPNIPASLSMKSQDEGNEWPIVFITALSDKYFDSILQMKWMLTEVK